MSQGLRTARADAAAGRAASGIRLIRLRDVALGLIVAGLFAAPAHAQAERGNEGPEAAVEEAARAEPADPRVFRQAQAYRGTKITISTNERRLRLIAGRDTLMNVPVAIGMNAGFEWEGREYFFRTPTGRRTVIGKEETPLWTPPDWHYKEKALLRGLVLVRLSRDDKIELSDGSFLITIGDQVGRLNEHGSFWPITPGLEIIFDGRIYMPPFGTAQRSVPDALGPYKLDMGDGYLIHGTNIYTEDTIGDAVSHGCVRMNNDDLEKLYRLVRPGVPVFIY